MPPDISGNAYRGMSYTRWQMPAGVALFHILHMAAEGGCAAVANRFEGLSLMRTEDVSPSLEESLLISAENIGHFGPMLAHRLDGMSFVG